MNFGQISNRLQRYERAKAKLNEFFVSDNDRKDNKLGQTSSTELLYSTIRVLSQYATLYCIDNDAESLYSLNMLISCVVELVEQYKPSNTSSTDWDAYVNSIIVLQERIKYGLAKESEIAAYEYGYSDRVVAKSVGQILEIKTSGKSSEYYKQIMKDCKEEIKEMLKVYPNYFSEGVQL